MGIIIIITITVSDFYKLPLLQYQRTTLFYTCCETEHLSLRYREKHFVLGVPNSPNYFFTLNFRPVHGLSKNS
jgi:hypothetical protein